MSDITEETVLSLISRAKDTGRHHNLSEFAANGSALISAFVAADNEYGHSHLVILLDTEINEPLVSLEADCIQYHVMTEAMKQNDTVGRIMEEEADRAIASLRDIINPN